MGGVVFSAVLAAAWIGSCGSRLWWLRSQGHGAGFMAASSTLVDIWDCRSMFPRLVVPPPTRNIPMELLVGGFWRHSYVQVPLWAVLALLMATAASGEFHCSLAPPPSPRTDENCILTFPPPCVEMPRGRCRMRLCGVPGKFDACVGFGTGDPGKRALLVGWIFRSPQSNEKKGRRVLRLPLDGPIFSVPQCLCGECL